MRLYQKNHPRVLESLEAAEHDLRAALQLLSSVAIGIERGTFVLPVLRDPTLPGHGGELNTLAEELSRCRLTSLVFLPQTNLGELDILAHLLNSTLLRSGAPASPGTYDSGRNVPPAESQGWAARLAEHHVCGIRVNTPIERKVDTRLATLVAALMAYGDTSQGAPGEPSTTREPAATLDELTTALHLLAKMALLAGDAQQRAPQEAARAYHSALAEADRRTVSLLVAAMAHQAPHEEETPASYLARIADALVLEFVGEEFRTDRVTPPELRGLFVRLYGPSPKGAETEERVGDAGHPVPEGGSSRVAPWADEAHAERLYERFWAELPVREKASVLRSPDAWCVPVAVLRRYLGQLINAGSDTPAAASLREARLVLLNYARCLESEEGKARRAVATGLIELYPLLEQLWPHQLPEELSRVGVRTLERENSPSIAGLLAAVTENLARLVLRRGDYAEFERILLALERAPRDADHAHLATLASRLVADERWLGLVDAALFNWPRSGKGANGPLDPVLPRLLRRDPERLLDRLGLLLTEPHGLDSLPAMARLLRAVGEPAIGALEARLFEPRRQRAMTAVKLLAAIRPERLVAALPRALPNWDWSLQDLAVSELARPLNQALAPGTARAFLAAVTDAHPMVVPMMLDQIGLAQETAAVPLLLEIAAGAKQRLSEAFIRIKAIEALGRMRATEAADLLRAILRKRDGLTHAEPAGLRAVAEEALALIENRPSSARVRAAQETLEKASLSFTRPRRYLRVPLSSPFAAQIEGPHSAPARVRTISLGGAFLESNRQLSVGDSISVEIRAGLRHIHSTAVVRNVAPNGGGVEFVHMKQEDREKLRRLVRRLRS
jgi:hypothetical protein